MNTWTLLLVAVVVYLLFSEPSATGRPIGQVLPEGHAAGNPDVPMGGGWPGLGDAAASFYSGAGVATYDTRPTGSFESIAQAAFAAAGQYAPPPLGAPPAAAADVFAVGATTGPSSQARSGQGAF